MLLLFNDTRSLCAFRALHQELTKPRTSDEVWLPVLELVRSILALFKMILSDMSEFLKCSSEEVIRLGRPSCTTRVKYLLTKRQTFESRAHPRLEKMQYLAHMDDRRKRAQLDMKHNKKQLHKIIHGIALLTPNSLNEDTRALTGGIDDCDHVLEELGDLGTAIDILQRKVSVRDTETSSLLAAILRFLLALL